MILAIDPGREKCGLAVLEENRRPVLLAIVPRHALLEKIASLITKHKIDVIVIGESADGKLVEKEMIKAGITIGLVFIAENNSTRQARERYWQENPPAGLWRFFPVSLRTPPRPVDDIAALILGERYLSR